MTRAELEAVVRAWVASWTAPLDAARFLALHDEGFVDHSPAGRSPDRAGALVGLTAFFDRFPEAVTTVEDLVIDEASAKVAVRWCTRSGDVIVRGIELVELRAGRVHARWGAWDGDAPASADRPVV